MKRILLSLFTLLALVLVANTALAQDKWSPVVGATYQYTVGNLTDGDAYVFAVSTSTESLTPASSSVTIAPGTSTGTVASSSTSSVTITWDESGTYNLWIEVTSGTVTECTSSNRRYRQITTQDNVFDVEIIALGVSTNETWTDWNTDLAEDLSDCYVRVPGTFDLEYTADDDGDSYVYYQLEVVDKNNTGYDWNFTLTPSGDLGGTIEYSTDGTNFTTYSGEVGEVTSQYVLIRVTEANTPAAQNLTLAVTATEDVGTGTVSDSDSVPGQNTTTFTINEFPDLDGASFN